jgi:hypothetical protein
VVAGVTVDGCTLPFPPPPPPQALNEPVNANAIENANTLLRLITTTCPLMLRDQTHCTLNERAQIGQGKSRHTVPLALVRIAQSTATFGQQKENAEASPAHGDSWNRPANTSGQTACVSLEHALAQSKNQSISHLYCETWRDLKQDECQLFSGIFVQVI